ncbi:hypothetical protein [Candidatus Odyssella acanthamoebae]|uniref:Prepilin type IV endopeptidase peptidase domain-containing protein n=1 Tax=Candidatus Odyssella acanthamoebae TaxID=91604 RepID=A0A077B1R1_9PROT|nr:hypothetical protein [Candidatus Paracaedibacter acanthamoebae]AIK96880.1 hypothetical protein ID47_09255 [Candidatus Paracaedibacter acanthamoebae]
MILILLLLAIILMGYDCRYRSVPLIPFVLFCLCVVSQGWSNPHWESCGMGCVLVMLCSGAEYLFKRPFLGIADKILLPISLMLVPLPEVGLYLVGVGALGLILSLFWRRVYGVEYFPFLPALITPLFRFILKYVDF